MPGALIALEGPKGAGKTTVCISVARRLAELGIADVVLTKEPTSEFNFAQEAHLSGLRLAQAIADDRAEHVRTLIRPALDENRVVLCDRYILSSLVFQGADGVSNADVWRLNQGFPLPSVNILLTANSGIIHIRRGQRETLTRLEIGRDPDEEVQDYLLHAEEMRGRGVGLVRLENSAPEDLENVVKSILEIVMKAAPGEHRTS